MDEFAIGDTVQITGAAMTGSVGTVVHIDERRERYLVRVTPQAQQYFAAADLQRFRG